MAKQSGPYALSYQYTGMSIEDRDEVPACRLCNILFLNCDKKGDANFYPCGGLLVFS